MTDTHNSGSYASYDNSYFKRAQNWNLAFYRSKLNCYTLANTEVHLISWSHNISWIDESNLFNSTARHWQTALAEHNKTVSELQLVYQVRSKCSQPFLARHWQAKTHNRMILQSRHWYWHWSARKCNYSITTRLFILTILTSKY